MTPKWHQNVSKMTPTWCQNDTKMIPKWFQNDLQMIPKWSRIFKFTSMSLLISAPQGLLFFEKDDIYVNLYIFDELLWLGDPGGTSFSLKYYACRQKSASWNTPPEPPEPVKWCQELRLRPHLPHAPGARMTVVTQTPSNYMCWYCWRNETTEPSGFGLQPSGLCC